MSAPEYLFIRTAGLAPSERRCSAIVDAIVAGGGDVVAARTEEEVEQLEPGTPPASVVIGRWGSRAALDRAWEREVGRATDSLDDDGLVSLAVRGLPPEGLPDQLEIPTVASVPPIPDSAPPTYMTIQGSVTDPVRIQGYRDVILPMLKELGAYYTVFAVEAGFVRPLRGTWSEQIFAISAWPTHQAAHDFWYSDRYQNVAVPIRTGIGAFHVHLLDGGIAPAFVSAALPTRG